MKAMPAIRRARPAESWQMSPDCRTYDFTLRKGVKFHNGETLTSEDVKFSVRALPRHRAKMLKERVLAVETPSPAGAVSV